MSFIPIINSKKFQCPHCNAVAKQDWANNKDSVKIIFEIIQHLFLDYRNEIQDYTQENIRKFICFASSGTIHLKESNWLLF